MTAPLIVATFPKNRRGEHVRVALENFRGHDLADIRVCVPLAEHAPTLTPTKTGLSVNVALLPELIAALQSAEVKAREIGMLGEGGAE